MDALVTSLASSIGFPGALFLLCFTLSFVCRSDHHALTHTNGYDGDNDVGCYTAEGYLLPDFTSYPLASLLNLQEN